MPFFQRHYSWREDNWQRLLDDIVALTEESDETKHFLGPLVCTPFHPVPGEVTPYQLIDGQQRLATLTVALAALRDIARLNALESLSEEIHEDYLIHRRRQGVQRFKVVPRLGDRSDYESIIEGKPAGTTLTTGLLGGYSFFKREWKRLVGGNGETAIRRYLIASTARLSLVTITVGGENPYEIFESLNSCGLPLEEQERFHYRMAFDTNDYLYAVDENGTSIVRFSPNKYERETIRDGFAGIGDIAIAPDGSIIAGDTEADKVFRITRYESPNAMRLSLRLYPGPSLRLFPGLSMEGRTGNVYRIEISQNIEGKWTSAATLMLDRTPYLWIDESAAADRKFYRAVQLP